MNTAEQILSRFGKGITGAATALQEPPTTVQYWFKTGEIPRKRWDEIIAKGAALGIPVSYAELLGISEQSNSVAPSGSDLRK